MDGPQPQRLRKIEPGFAPVRLPSAPKGLTKEAVVRWTEIGGILHHRGLLGPDTLDILEGYCRLYGDMRRFAKVLEDEGYYPDGRRHPASTDYFNALKEMRAYACELGLTPARRAVANKIKKEFKTPVGGEHWVEAGLLS